MKKILVPFDGSASARRALTFLVDLARDSPNLEVHLLNVQMLPLPYGDRLEGLLEAATKHAHEIALEGAGILAAQGIRATPHERLGDPVNEIAKAVAELGCDSILMGTRGMNNFSNLVMGSVATRVVHEVSVPVVLVK
ncbi:universal stress protein family [Azotobacter vinelandii CA]|uniref:Universal stress protein family n=2 Tax=Azotobacter vinelandii TaxID=354 RepID=C1DI14_AZOVD|nr:universal stress protein [Azotobacter vinelandii]ACO80747.1 universal stress protein family [Azotobacter vinelandii DJ]AGK14292.1 universal stress protein family [Azotobacter vinelandii CA]AGK22125.1 universal stress protein family [Azotobacter vinelandii CA6]WKN21550.1 universal stress protein [Azotobacter vinelandii]SFX04470.1 Nucleotide-binding universal stress protein, UspA family [Azotobacter vinelandii]